MSDKRTVWLCNSCFYPALYDDFKMLDYYHSPAEADRMAKVIREGLSALGPNLIDDYDINSGDGHEEFSSQHECGCCHSRLAGEFHRFAILSQTQELYRGERWDDL